MDGLANQFGQSVEQSVGSDNFRLHQVNIHYHQFHDATNADLFDPDDVNSLLPIRIKCAAHSLNLVGKTDATKALSDRSYAQIYCQSISKLNLLWKFCGYRKSSDDIKWYIGKTIIRPHKIRWNSLYDSIHEILNIDQAKLDALFCHLKIAILDPTERQFLQEFLIVLKPIARGLSTLEGNRYFGYNLISLFNIRAEIEHIVSSVRLKFCKPLLLAVRDGFFARFKDHMDMNKPLSVPLYLAMLSHPSFKMNYIREIRENSSASHYLHKCMGILLKAIEAIDQEEESVKERERIESILLQVGTTAIVEPTDATANNSNANSVFHDSVAEIDISKLLDAECGKADMFMLEIKSYLREPLTQDLKSLEKHPNIKKVFLKYNGLMTSEADCERIFSYAATTLNPKRRQMSDEHFCHMLTLFELKY
ncbi:uncharacterized protein LOC129571338 isoform X2 [Sitodiplosis mosellana]|uniref:uncharacterized protein LOC129571338 isoform X2 n=1 Tax=Sitodiplosis mosellana TaxID=263140 RepID=UPI0024440567|nr:uncharacterized protein LOC129571338 isoform X2 [Sitodiplosis mosellana]